MTDHVATLDALLARFDAARRPASTPYRWAHRHDGGGHAFHLVFSSLIHGDEVGSLPGLVRATEDLHAGRITYSGRATLLLGNPEAARQDVRFLEADLNRVFVQGMDGAAHEVRRARALMPLLDAADVYLDFHQTIKASRQPFYIFPWGERAWQWARALRGATVWVTRNPGQAFSSGMMCADEFVRERGQPGITIELGQKGWSDDAADTTYAMITGAMALADDVAAGRRTLAEAAESQPDLEFYETKHREAFTDPKMTLRPGIWNFEPVDAGATLSAPGTPTMQAARAGAVLFPKYPPRDGQGAALDPRPGEIFRIVTPLERHPLELWGGGS